MSSAVLFDIIPHFCVASIKEGIIEEVRFLSFCSYCCSRLRRRSRMM
jgi:hypothetical protein